MKILIAVIIAHYLVFVVQINHTYSKQVVGDPALTAIVQEVFTDARRLGYTIPDFDELEMVFSNKVKIPDENGNITIGDTDGYYTDYPTITIYKQTWKDLDDTRRYLLVAHELGHGIWKRDHDETILPDFTQKSIMAPMVIDVDIFKKKRDYYLSELFSIQGTI